MCNCGIKINLQELLYKTNVESRVHKAIDMATLHKPLLINSELSAANAFPVGTTYF